MITGIVNAELEALLRLIVQGLNGDEHEVEAVIDTGFNGFLTLPTELVEQLKLPWLFRQQCELADGCLSVFDVHAGTVLWNGRPRKVEIEVADTQPLLGMAMLAKHSLHIDVQNGGAVLIDDSTD